MLFALLPASPAAAKSFTIDKFYAEATLNSDASMTVVEHLTYTFDGNFHNGTRPIPKGSYYSISDMRVQENGVDLPISGAPYNLRWTFDATNETRTFDISYRVIGAAQVGPDVAELYWKWIGDEHPGIGAMRVILQLPNAQDVRAWAHGPLSGSVTIRGDLVDFDVANLPASTFVEGRVTMPSTFFTVPPKGEARLPGILKEEGANADAANNQRFGTPVKKEDPNKFRNAIALAVISIVGGWGAFYAIWRRWGRDPKRPDDVGKYWYEVPEDSPATVVSVLGKGSALAGALLDLAQRGYLRIDDTITEGRSFLGMKFGQDADWTITSTRPPDETLKPFERALLDYTFADGSPTTQKTIQTRSQKYPRQARRFEADFDREVSKTVDDIYVATNTGVAMLLNFAVTGLAGFIGVLSIQKSIVGLIPIANAVLIALATTKLGRRTELGARRAAEWEGLRNYLKDFGNFEEAPVGHLILWERYLVYATALGVADELSKGLEQRIPELRDDPSFAAWYGSSAGLHFNSLAAFSVASAGSFAAPSDNASSGSGGGGGFSGGGGGGGGGGGAGAS